MATDLRRQKVENLASSFNLDWLINLMDNKFEFQGQVASTINDKKRGMPDDFELVIMTQSGGK